MICKGVNFSPFSLFLRNVKTSVNETFTVPNSLFYFFFPYNTGFVSVSLYIFICLYTFTAILYVLQQRINCN